VRLVVIVRLSAQPVRILAVLVMACLAENSDGLDDEDVTVRDDFRLRRRKPAVRDADDGEGSRLLGAGGVEANIEMMLTEESPNGQ
jgi:hypothetical protein